MEDLESAVDELQASGFSTSDLTLLARDEVVEKKLGHHYTRVERAVDDPKAPRTAWVSKRTIDVEEAALVGAPFFIAAIAAGGAVVATAGTALPAIGAAIAAGGLAGTFGGLVAGEIGEEHADYYEQQLKRGGILLWAHTNTKELEEKATTILIHHKASHVHVHEIAVDA